MSSQLPFPACSSCSSLSNEPAISSAPSPSHNFDQQPATPAHPCAFIEPSAGPPPLSAPSASSHAQRQRFDLQPAAPPPPFTPSASPRAQHQRDPDLRPLSAPPQPPEASDSEEEDSPAAQAWVRHLDIVFKNVREMRQWQNRKR